MAVYKVNGTDISVSNSSSSNNKISTTYFKDNGSVITGDSYSSSWSNYMIRAFDSAFKESGNDINICKSGRRPATTLKTSTGSGTFNMTGSSSSGFSINGVNLGAGNEVFYVCMCGGGGSGAVGSGTKSGGGGGGGGGISMIVIANANHQFVIGGGGAGKSGKNTAGAGGSSSTFKNNGTTIVTCGGGGGASVGGGGGRGSTTINNSSLMSTYTGGYYSTNQGGAGGMSGTGGQVAWTKFDKRPEAGTSVTKTGGSGVSDGGAGGGGASMFGGATAGQKYTTASSSASQGGGSGGTGYVLIGTPKNTGSGGAGRLEIYY